MRNDRPPPSYALINFVEIARARYSLSKLSFTSLTRNFPPNSGGQRFRVRSFGLGIKNRISWWWDAIGVL